MHTRPVLPDIEKCKLKIYCTLQNVYWFPKKKQKQKLITIPYKEHKYTHSPLKYVFTNGVYTQLQTTSNLMTFQKSPESHLRTLLTIFRWCLVFNTGTKHTPNIHLSIQSYLVPPVRLSLVFMKSRV